MLTERIYHAYPRKVGKRAALAAIEKAVRRRAEAMGGKAYEAVSAYELHALTAKYAQCVARWPLRDRQYVPHPATWFNQDRFDDDQSEWVRDATQLLGRATSVQPRPRSIG